jgi:hypothetical protein
MVNIYIDKLIELNNITTEAINKSASCTEKLEYLQKELYSYSEIISSFFVGKENEIKEVYSIIRNNSHPYNKISVTDINLALHNYEDYFSGLTHFANLVCGLVDTDNQVEESISNRINSIKERDNEFVESLFENHEMVTIDSAMSEVEVLVDIYRELDEFIQVCKDVCNKVTTNDCKKYKTYISDAYGILVNSIHNYCTNCIKNILTIYSEIEDSIKVRESVKGSPIVPKYQIF